MKRSAAERAAAAADGGDGAAGKFERLFAWAATGGAVLKGLRVREGGGWSRRVAGGGGGGR